MIGPANDGGHYLFGLRKPCAELFQGKPPECDTVFTRPRKTWNGSGRTPGSTAECRSTSTPKRTWRPQGFLSASFPFVLRPVSHRSGATIATDTLLRINPNKPIIG
ncbi:MAG: hypothetical protein IPO60_08245 [Flavobacteriales bacterium]|nr:hypothetical protein [Flavobacteriales bacterium]